LIMGFSLNKGSEGVASLSDFGQQKVLIYAAARYPAGSTLSVAFRFPALAGQHHIARHGARTGAVGAHGARRHA